MAAAGKLTVSMLERAFPKSSISGTASRGFHPYKKLHITCVHELVKGGVKGKVPCFVDRDDYVYLHSLLSSTFVSPIYAADSTQFTISTPVLRRFDVLQKAESAGQNAVVAEISRRQCSNEEDRVLAVLASLGLDGKMVQLRTGQTLAHQMVEVCGVMAKCNPGGLIKLCVAFQVPYVHSKKLSWAPHFFKKPHPEDIFLYEHFCNLHHIVAKVSDVAPRGLSLSCHVLKARFVPYHHHARQCKAEGCLSCYQQDADYVLQIIDGHTLPCEFSSMIGTSFDLSASGSIHGKVAKIHSIKNRQCCKGFMVIPIFALKNESEKNTHRVRVGRPYFFEYGVWLLLLGTSDHFDDAQEPRVLLVFMVCLGETTENLQKIGLLKMLPTYTACNGRRSTLHLESFKTMHCTVGGFGTRDYKTWNLQQLHASLHTHELASCEHLHS